MNYKLITMMLVSLTLMSVDETGSISFLKSQLSNIEKIKVVSKLSHTTIFPLDNKEMKGPELELLRNFGAFVGKEIDISFIKEGDKLPKADIYVLGPISEPVENTLSFNKSISALELLCNTKKPVSPILFSFTDSLEVRNQLNEIFPENTFRKVSSFFPEKTLELANQYQDSCAVVPGLSARLYERHYPNLKIYHTLNTYSKSSWHISKDNDHLQKLVSMWLRNSETNGTITKIENKYHQYLSTHEDHDTKKLQLSYITRLPKFKKYFKEAESKYGISWEFLAALSFQESQWDNSAVSFTGVRGLMMLTERTAKQLGVSDRLDPRQSILGAAKYIQQFKNKLKDQVAEPDLTLMALAAYNVGFGHLQDARKLTQSFGMDSNSWLDVKEVLPKLSEKAYYQHLKFGKARGKEPVHFVQRIRNYLDIIHQIELKTNPNQFASRMKLASR